MRLSSILLLLSAFVGIINSQYILVEEFKLQGTSCSGSQSSFDSQSLLDSLISLKSFWGSSHSSSFLKASQSSGEVCPSTSIGGSIVREGVCFQNGEPLPSVYSVSGDTIVRTFYNDTDINCEGKPVDTVTAINGNCYSGCVLDLVITLKLSTVATPVVPTNTAFEAVYTGECNGNFKNSLVSIFYRTLNTCIDNIITPQGLISLEVSCNSTLATENMFGNNDCGGSPIYTSHQPLINQCGDKFNVIDICNN
ncbi:hypothetical protein ACTFIZ_010729 [Dictyostelium cf. discoideum]